MGDDNDDDTKRNPPRSPFDGLFGSPFGKRPKMKIPDGMNADQFAALMREAFNGSTCDCPDCVAVRERRKNQEPRNTDPDAN